MDDEHENYVDWMHPSWRDLVIEHLANNGEARRKFLAKCGSTGFLLALSTAGGAKGERYHPLLLRPDDWSALRSSVTRAHASGTHSQYNILTALNNAMQSYLDQDEPTNHSHAIELHELASLVLEDLRNRWTNEQIAFSANLIQKYFAVSIELAPLPPAPDLRASWKEAWSEAESDFHRFDPDSSDSRFTSVYEWTHLAIVIQDNEPRFLRQIKFPTEFNETVESFIELIEQHMEADFTFDSSEELSGEENRLATLGTILDRLECLFPSFSNRLSSLSSMVAQRKYEHGESREELEEKERAQSEAKHKKISGRLPPDEKDESFIEEAFDIEKLFEDL